MTKPYIYMYPFSPRLPTHPGCLRTLSRVLCDLQQVRVWGKSFIPFIQFSIYWVLTVYQLLPIWRMKVAEGCREDRLASRSEETSLRLWSLS